MVKYPPNLEQAGFLRRSLKPHFSFFGVIGVLLSFVGKKKKAPLTRGIFKGGTPLNKTIFMEFSYETKSKKQFFLSV